MSQREQQTARVNVDDATWQAFRIRAIQANRSVADELARLVRNELRRAGLLDPAGPSSSGPPAAEARETRAPHRPRPQRSGHGAAARGSDSPTSIS